MLRMFLAVAAIASVSLTPALAQQDRMTNTQYVAAAKCVAHAELEQISADAPNVSALRAAIANNTSSVSQEALAQAETLKRTLRRDLRRGRLSDERLRTVRDRACARFVESGLVRRHSGTP